MQQPHSLVLSPIASARLDRWLDFILGSKNQSIYLSFYKLFSLFTQNILICRNEKKDDLMS